MTAVLEASRDVGVGAAAHALGVARATAYRRKSPPLPRPRRPRPPPARKLAPAEVERALAVLHEPRFVDSAPEPIVATLLDEGVYIASARTLYRLLAARGEVKERRDQLRHERYAVPRLEAPAPNCVWSWDITKLRGPQTGILFFFYVILDIYSRYVVGWMLAASETGELARTLFEETCRRHGVAPGSLVFHADRGSSMRSLTLAEKADALGVTLSFSRPRVSNDNAFSESQFKTLKYRPDFPDRFGSIVHANQHVARFVDWYNREHRHSGIGYLTPEDVHFRRAATVIGNRQRILDAASAAHPERFAHGASRVLDVPTTVWINPPTNVLTVKTA